MLLAIDGNSLVHRSFHAQAGSGLRSADGRPLWAIRGLLTQLVAAAERIAPAAIVVGFDDAEASLRRERWPQYKATRTAKLDTLVSQLDGAARVLRQMGVAVVVPDGLEADDVLASAARFAPTVGATTVIMTSDRDSFALIDEHTRVLRIINGGVDASPMLTPERLVTLLGVRPEQYRDFAALRGDPSDNLPGVRGVGPKTAAKLLAALGSAAAAFEDLAGDGARVVEAVGQAVADRLAEPAARQAWELNCEVMRMHAHLDLGLQVHTGSGGDRSGAGNGGAGRLPLPPDAVSQAFHDHQLTWTAPTALQVLCHHEAPERPVRTASWSSSSAEQKSPGAGLATAYRSGRRHPPLPPRQTERQKAAAKRLAAASAQLSLFD